MYTAKRSSSSTRPNRARAGGQNQGISGHRSARPGGQNGCISAHSGSPSAPVSQVRARAPAHTRARGQRQNNARSSPSDAHGRAAVLRGVVGRVVGYQRERRRYRDGVRAPTEKTTPGPRPGGLPAGRQIPAAGYSYQPEQWPEKMAQSAREASRDSALGRSFGTPPSAPSAVLTTSALSRTFCPPALDCSSAAFRVRSRRRPCPAGQGRKADT